MATIELDQEPVELDKMMQINFSYSFDPLKSAMMYIMKQLKHNSDEVRELRNQLGLNVENSGPSAPTGLQGTVSDLQARIVELEESLMTLESRSGDPAISLDRSPTEGKHAREESKRGSNGLEGRVAFLETELRKLRIKVNKIPGANRDKAEVDASFDEWKEKLDIVTLSLRNVYADKLELQKVADKAETAMIQMAHLEKNIGENSEGGLIKEVKEIKEELAAQRQFFMNTPRAKQGDSAADEGLDPEGEDLHDDFDEPEDNKEEKKDERKSTFASGAKGKVQKIFMSNTRDQQQLRLMRKKLLELEKNFNETKTEISGINPKETQNRLAELASQMDKKASFLDLKKLYSTLDDSNSQNEDIKKNIEELRKSIKELEENEELNQQKLKLNSLENKLIIGLKNIKDLQTKVTETMTLQIMPQADQANEEEKREEAMSQFMDETNEKVAKLKDAITTFKSEFETLSRGVEEKIELKASKESLIDLENKIFKEIDKVVAAITKRFSESSTVKKGTKFLEVQVRKLFELYNALISSRESEETTFLKKPLGGYSCAACEKEIKNLYNKINQDPEYANWNKFPMKEGTFSIPKAGGYSKIEQFYNIVNKTFF